MNKLRITYEDPKTLTLDPKNARLHPEPNQRAINYSLSEFDFRKVAICVWEKNKTVYAGNALVIEAIRRGYTEVPVAWIPADWTEAKVKAFGVADNQIALLGEWDLPNLDETLEEIKLDFNLDDLGFSETDLDTLFADSRKKEAVEDDFDTTPETEAISRLGDLWYCGKHKVLCGDCTVRENVERVMGGEKAVLFATDPPYGCNAGNISFTAQRDDIEAITKDDLEGEEMKAFLEIVFKTALPHLADDCAWYLWHPMLTQGYFAAAAAAAAAADLIIHRQIIWAKSQFIFGRGDYHWRHELCFFGWRKGNRPPFYGERNQDTVWNIAYDGKRSEIGHPTAKPVKLFAIPMQNHTRTNEVCYEPFAGSGSQIIAGEQLGRRVFALELEPRYVDVICRRYVSLVGSPEGVWCERDGEKIAYQELFGG